MHHLVKKRCFEGLTGLDKQDAYHESGIEAACFENELPWESHLQTWFAKDVHCYLTKIGFALFTPNMALVTWVRFAILSLGKWPLPNQSKNHPLLKNYKTYPDLVSTTWKNSSKKSSTEEMGLIKAFQVF